MVVAATVSDPPTSAPSQNLKPRNPTPPPLRPSTAATPPRKPRSKNVPSRYLSPSPSASTSTTTTTTSTATTATSTSSSSSGSRRFTSPLLSRSTNSAPSPSPAPKRSQSADRRRQAAARPTTPAPQGNAGEVSAAAKLLITSTRSLSVSFQGESFSLPISKAKRATPERRRLTPVRDRDQVENSKPVDQPSLLWPARARQSSVDSSVIGDDEKRKVGRFGSGNVGKLLQQSVIEDSRRRVSFDGRLSLDLGKVEFLKTAARNPDSNSAKETSLNSDSRRKVSFDGRLSLDLGKVEFLKTSGRNPDSNSGNETSLNCDLTASDTDSVSSGSTSGGGGSVNGTLKSRTGSRGIALSAKFWQETNSRLRRLQDPGSPLSTSPGSRITAATPFKLSQSKRFSTDSPLASSPRTMGSPVRGAMRPSSPSKLFPASPSKGMSSPSRTRPVTGNSCAMPSVLNFSVDIRRGKIGEDRIVDAHMLRLLYNRYLQWRFVNARADTTFSVQTLNAEKNLWNAWITISELRHSVSLKRMKLLLLRQKLKLSSILKRQIAYLEEWSLGEKEHSSSFLGAAEALRASTLRLPIVGKATIDIQQMKDALGSAVEVMRAITSSICSLLLKVEEVNSLVAELGSLSAKERFSLNQCKDFLSIVAALQVKDCSLRTQILQLNPIQTTTAP